MKETCLLSNVLTLGCVLWLITDGLRAWNDGKWACGSGQRFKRSWGHLKAKGSSWSICGYSLTLCVFNVQVCGSALHPFVLYVVWSHGSADWKSVFFTLHVGKTRAFWCCISLSALCEQSKVQWDYFLESRLKIELISTALGCFSTTLHHFFGTTSFFEDLYEWDDVSSWLCDSKF